ncbi:MAG: O-antigen ligase family protein [Alphaproteobacteria bacterium]
MGAKNTIPIHSIILICCFYLSLIRGTSIGLFYPSSELQLNSIDYTLIKYMNYALLVGIIGYLFTANNYRVLLDKALKPPILIFISICLISIIFSDEKVQSLKHAIALIAISFPIIFYIYRYGSDNLLDEISRFIILLSIASLLYVIIMPQYGMMSGKHDGAWRGLFDHKNNSGPFFALGFYFLLNRLQSLKKKHIISLMLGMVICILFVVFSKSSTAIITFIMAGALYFGMQIMYRFKNAAERLGLFLALFSLLILSIFFGAGKFNDIIHSTTGKDATLSGRTEIWAPLMDLSYERPLYGYGLGIAQRPKFLKRIHKFIDFKPKSTHNSYIDLILGIGYPGAILFLILVLKVIFTNLICHIDNLTILRNKALFMSILLSLFLVSFTSSFILLGRSFVWISFLSALLCLAQPSSHKDNDSPTGKT